MDELTPIDFETTAYDPAEGDDGDFSDALMALGYLAQARALSHVYSGSTPVNATEQRTHRTVTDGLTARLDDLEVVLDRAVKNDAWCKAQIDNLYAIYAAHQLRVAELTNKPDDVVDRNFSGRLRWLLTGR